MNAESPVEDRLYQTVASVLGLDPVELDENSSPESIPSWDSLNHLNLIMALESEFGISLSPDEAIGLQSVADIRELLGESKPRPKTAISFSDCRYEDVPEVKGFIAKSYGENYVLGINDAYFHWQFAQTPISRGRDFHLRLARVNGKVAGCLGFVPVELSIAGEVVRACWLANWMVDPDQRHLGLGPILVREVSKDFEATLALGANAEARDILSRMGWTDFGMLPRYVRVLDIEGASQLTESGQLDWPAGPPARAADTGVTVRSVEQFGDETTRLWDNLWSRRIDAAGTRRTAAFLKWRYTDHCQFAYSQFEARRQGELVGIAVYRVEKARDLPVRVGRIVELVAQRDARQPLLEYLVNHAKQAGAVAIDYFRGSEESWLGEQGFLPGDHPVASQIPVLYQPLDRRRAGIRFLADLSRIEGAERVTNWYVSKADGDQDRPN